MKRKGSWSDAEIAYLREHYGKAKTRDIAKRLGRTYSAVKTTATRFGLKTGKHRPWTEEEVSLVRELYPHRPTKEISARLARPVGSVYQQAEVLGVKKSLEFLSSPLSGIIHKGERRGIGTEFKKGLAPANKGLRRPGWYRGRMRETQFKKGSRSGKAAENWKPIGTILPDSDGYLRIKVREAEYGKEPFGFGNVKVWPLLQRHVWEQNNGPIPPGHKIVFKDGNKQHVEIENLECLSSAQLLQRNSLWKRYPRELAETIQLVGALKRKIRGKEKKRDGKK